MAISLEGMEIKVTHYRCKQCGAEDKDWGRNPPAPQALVCWNCKSGRGQGPYALQLQTQINEGYGMLPLDHPAWLS